MTEKTNAEAAADLRKWLPSALLPDSLNELLSDVAARLEAGPAGEALSPHQKALQDFACVMSGPSNDDKVRIWSNQAKQFAETADKAETARDEALARAERAEAALLTLADQADHCVTGFRIGKYDITNAMVELDSASAAARAILADRASDPRLQAVRAEALEEAAKIAEQWLESSWQDEVFAARSIADAIRKAKGGGGGDERAATAVNMSVVQQERSHGPAVGRRESVVRRIRMRTGAQRLQRSSGARVSLRRPHTEGCH